MSTALSHGGASHAADHVDRAHHRVIVRTFRECDQVGELTQEESRGSEFTQLSAGRFFGSTTRLILGDLRLHWTVTSGKTLNRSRTDPRLLYFHVPRRAQALVWDGETIQEPLLIQNGGQDEFARYARDLDGVAFGAPKQRLLAEAAARAGMDPEAYRMPRGPLRDPGPAARRLAAALLEVGRVAAEQPASLQASGFLQLTRRRLESALLDLLVEQLGRGDTSTTGTTPKLRVVQHAERHLQEAGGRRITVAGLAGALGVSTRTLQLAFLDVCGVSPLRYMHLRRLRAARRALLEAAPARGRVKRAAYEAGFTELGRFSSEYRNFFGEFPSDTLRRSPLQLAPEHGGGRPDPVTHA